MTDTAARPGEAPAAPETLHIIVDGVDVEARPGELIIEAAERAGVYIPRFCYHPRMEPVGMCRMCLVEVSGPRGFSLQPACYLKVTDGQEIVTESPKARKAQEGVLEFLLINHPLDCPVCDKGGECPLQDQALSHGPGESRFVEEKRHWDKPIEIGPLVYLDRERCIQCARCTRFADEIAGEALIDFAFRGSNIEVAPFPEQPFTSYFAGNTIQICPVGALTSPAYRFKSRPWDLEQVETTCTSCSVGCRVVAQSSAGALVRYLGVDVDGVNQSWLCDKGRYAIESVGSANRLREPLVRRGDDLVAVRWHEALGEVAAGARQAFAAGGEHAIGVIGGARLSNEDAYAWSKLARTVFATDDVDCQLGDGLPAEFVLGLPRATIDDAANAKVIVVASGDVREELPVLFLRLRAAVAEGATIIELSPVATALTPLAALRLAHQPGAVAGIAAALIAKKAPTATAGVTAADLVRARALITEATERGAKAGTGTVVIIGRQSLADSADGVIAAASTLAGAWPAARFLPALRRANVHGALDMGLAPGVLPGRVTLDSARSWFDEGWNAVLPAGPGLDAAGILAAAADGRCKMLVLLGADPLTDFPDRELALAALETVPFLVALGTHPDQSSAVLAHVVLPVVGDGERSGTTTNIEGRVSRLAAKVIAPGVSWPAWTIASEIARRLGGDLGFENLEGIAEEIARLAPAYRGVTMETLARPAHRDGIVLPLANVAVSIGSRAGRPIDPMATPGIGSVEEQGAPLRVGSATPLGGDAERDDEAIAPAASRPALLSAPTIGTVPAVSAPVSGDHRLVVTRTLYDGGTLVAASPSLAPLAPSPTARLHPSELERLGVSPGTSLRLRSGRGEIILNAIADSALARDVVAINANVFGSEPHAASDLDETVRFGAARLIAAGSLVTDVKVERLAE